MKKQSLSLFIDGQEHQLSYDSMLIGSAKTCEIQLPEQIAAYHQAIITIDSHLSMMITPLPCSVVMYLNGAAITSKTTITEGDTLSFLNTHSEIVSSTQSFELTRRNASQINNVLNDSIEEAKIYIPKKESENDILIDDEYYDITFDDTHANNSSSLELSHLVFNTENYIESEQLDKPFPISKEDDTKLLRISTVANNVILEQFYFPLKDGIIQGSKYKRKGMVTLDIIDENKIPLIKISDQKIFAPQSDFFDQNKISQTFDDESSLILTRGIYQVFVDTCEANERLENITSFRRDKDFFKQTAIKFFSVFIPLLFIMLVDYKVEEIKPKKKLAIIYKYKGETKKVSSSNPSKNKNTGHKKTKQPDKKVSKSKAGKPKKAPKKRVKVAAKTKSSAKKVVKKVTKPKLKTYNFKMAANTSSAFSAASKVAIKNSRSPASVNTSAAVSNMKTSVNASASAAIGNLGSDSSGSAQSYGAKGLSSKRGRDTSSIQTKTVVLGSIDPELLRKILQQYLPQFRHCYQQELAYNSEDIKGIVDLNFEINKIGRAGKMNIKAKDSRFSKKGINCMSKVLSIINFPKPKGGGRVAVRQPLNFYAESSKS